MYDGGAFLARKDISLHRERIARGNLAIGPKTPTQKIPIVFPGTAALRRQGTVVEIIRENAVVCFFLDVPPILNRALRSSLRTSTRSDQSALRFRGPLRHNVNYSVNGVGPPGR